MKEIERRINQLSMRRKGGVPLRVVECLPGESGDQAVARHEVTHGKPKSRPEVTLFLQAAERRLADIVIG